MPSAYDTWADRFRSLYLGNNDPSTPERKNRMTSNTQKAHEEILAIYAERNKSAEVAQNLLRDGFLTREGTRKHMTDRAEQAGWNERLTRIAENAEAEVTYAAAAREALIGSITSPAAADVNEALLNEMQLNRAWNRIRPSFDASEVKVDVIERAMATATPIERAAILQEAPAYLERAGVKNPVKLLHGALRRADPAVEAAFDAERVAAQTRDIVHSNIRAVSAVLGHADELSSFHGIRITDPSTAVPGFSDGNGEGGSGR